jgi:hypothetical protein
MNRMLQILQLLPLFDGPIGSKEGKLQVGKVRGKATLPDWTFEQETKMSLEVRCKFILEALQR